MKNHCNYRLRLVVAVLSLISRTLLFGQAPQVPAQPNVNPGIPELMKFSGVLKDAAGNPLTNTVGVVFAVYSEQTGGVPLWQETQNVQFSQGRYAVYLGQGTSGGVPAELFASAQPQWLGVRALLPNEEEQPRLQLVSVPYALKAADSDTLGGLPPSAYLKTGNGGPNGVLPANSASLTTLNSLPPSSSTVTTSGGTIGVISEFHTTTDIENSPITDSGGNISVANQLTVHGTSALAGVTAQSVNGVLYPAACGTSNPPTWCSGSDLGQWINAAVAALTTGSISDPNFATSGYQIGTIVLPICNGNVATPVAACNIGPPPTGKTTPHIGPGVNLVGQGKFATVITCTYAGDCILFDHSGSGQYNHSVLSNSRVENFTIQGNGVAGQNIFHFQDLQGLEMHSVVADGAMLNGVPSSSTCFYFQNMQNPTSFTERNTFIDISDGYNCKIGYRFTAPSGHGSFGYNRFLDIKANTNGAQTAVSIEGNTYMYSGIFHLTVNKGGAGSTIWHMQGSAQFYENELQLMGEENGSGGYFLDLGATTELTYTGNIIFTAIQNNIVPGAILIHWLDSDYFTAVGSTLNRSLTVGPGAWQNDQGPGTINVTGGYYVNGAKALVSHGIGAAGSQAVFAGDGSVTSSTAGSTGHATCWKAVGQIGYCSTPIGADGTCTCN